ncbi:MAG: tripartite tricarboxylate transporter substrate binding protein [Burkholderiaceae bacterium]|jgi:tripartite-type tricarboxylate transporter receptor subunit TctC|nr:tripartite tricarboxylate transporter substrate binding protein [Burkholderiaceae bacterium]
MTQLPSRRHALALLASLTALPLGAGAAGYPDRPVTVVVPYSPGGGVDIITRLITAPMAELLGQSMVVDNKPGGGTNIGMGAVARGPADGHLLLTASNTLTTNKALYAKLSFDPLKDLVPVGRIGEAALVVVVPAKSPHRTLADLIAAGKARSGGLSYGTAGVGSSGHMASALLERAGGFQAVHVPYKGGSAAVTDLLGGRLDFMAINPLEVTGHVGNGTLRALAVLNRDGSRLLPGVATARSQGVNVQATVWWGLVAPAGTPAAVVQTLNQALNKALAQPAVQQKLADIGATPLGGTPAEFGAFIQSESAELGEVIKAAHIRAD